MEDKIKSGLGAWGFLTLRFRRLWFPLLIGFFMIFYIGFGLVYWQEQQARKSISEEINLKEQELKRFVPIDDKLTRYYQAVENSIPTGIKGEDVIVTVLNVAKKAGFNVDPGTTTISLAQKKGARKEKVIKSDYEILSFSLSGVQGGYKEVIDFISMLYSEPGLETMVLEKVNIVRKEDGVNNTANIDFGIYTRPGKGKG